MGKQDWYRNRTWSQEIKAQFFARLKRSRTEYNRAQYLRIQAYYLQQEAAPPLYEDALELLDQLFRECPHPAELASAYLQRAQCLDKLGRRDEAVQAYLASLTSEADYPGVKTNAPLDFAMFVLRHRLNRYYETVLSHLEHVEMLALFPFGQYQANAAFAIILAEQGRPKEARQFAINALQAAGKTESGFRFHSGLGLVEDVDPRLHKQLERLAGE